MGRMVCENAGYMWVNPSVVQIRTAGRRRTHPRFELTVTWRWITELFGICITFNCLGVTRFNRWWSWWIRREVGRECIQNSWCKPSSFPPSRYGFTSVHGRLSRKPWMKSPGGPELKWISLSVKQNAYRYKDKWALFSPIEKLVILALSTELLVMLRQSLKLISLL